MIFRFGQLRADSRISTPQKLHIPRKKIFLEIFDQGRLASPAGNLQRVCMIITDTLGAPERLPTFWAALRGLSGRLPPPRRSRRPHATFEPLPPSPTGRCRPRAEIWKSGDFDDKLYVNNNEYLKDRDTVIQELMNYALTWKMITGFEFPQSILITMSHFSPKQ